MDFLSFHLPDEFIDQYKNIEPEWGFPIGGGNYLSELIFYTKYSRLKQDGTRERWYETCRRFVEGFMSILKDHCIANRTNWNENKALATAKDAYIRAFRFQWTPPGRGVQFMGTDLVNGRKNSAFLQNCAFLSTAHLSSRSKREAIYPFVTLMEMCLCGIGVGFDTDGAGKLTIYEPNPNETITFVVPDTREGWAESHGVLLISYFFPNQPTVIFDYSKIRDEGAIINGFGGVAPGPRPLMRCHDTIRKLFNGRSGTKITSEDIVDINNISGKAVVSGGNRRTAELALGNDDDKNFINLKNWELNPERMGSDGWGNLSNNSIKATVGKDYTYLVDNIIQGGEPGFVWLELLRKYGRLIDPVDNRDYRVMGVNPCGEQPLEHGELCTLVNTYPTHHDSLEDFHRTLKVAYLYAKAVTLLSTPWPETNEIMQRNRRIGLSMSGLAQFIEDRGWHELKRWMDSSFNIVKTRDITFSEWLGVRESIKHTTIKPDGTTGLLCAVTPGDHWPTDDIYIRRVRYQKNNPLVIVLRKAGYHIEPDITDPEFTVVVELPTRGPNIRTEREVSLWEKVALAALCQEYWSNNAVSCTATFLPEEADQISAVLKVFDGRLKTISFLPLLNEGDTYQQSPYSRISNENYEALIKDIKPMNWKELYGMNDDVDLTSESFCTTDKCDLPRR